MKCRAGRDLLRAFVLAGVFTLAVTAEAQTITTVAGGGAPPVGLAATRWSAPFVSGVAVDSAGNLYTSVTFLNMVLESSPGGSIVKVIGTGLGGYSGDGGPAGSARLSSPGGIALDSAGNLYIADTGNHVVRKVAASTGVITTFAGTGAAGFSGDGGLPTAAALNNPTDVSVGSQLGNIFIADKENHVIRKITASSGKISTVAGTGGQHGYSGDGGPASSALLSGPLYITVDGNGNIYIADTGNNAIRRVSQTNGVITTVAGNGTEGFSGDGAAATSAKLNSPTGLAIEANGNICFADSGNSRIRRFALGGTIATIAGNGTGGYNGDGIAATGAELKSPAGLAIDSSGIIYVADELNSRVRAFSPGGRISTAVGNGNGVFAGDGGAATSALLTASSLAFDSTGNLYLADPLDHVVRKVTAATGIISSVAGTGTGGYSGDGTAASGATLNGPTGVAVDASGNLYIADSANNVIRKVTAATGVITTVAGNGTAGFGGDGGLATSAKLNAPWGVAVGSQGNIFISDRDNNAIRSLLVSTGRISTFAGTIVAGYSGDNGAAAAAQLNSPLGMAVDGSGNLFIADAGNNVIRRVSLSSSAITTVAGTGTSGYTGDGGAATRGTLQGPQGLAVDSSGNLYIADSVNNVIRKVTAGGVISTYAGTGSPAFAGDGGPAISAELSEPATVAIGSDGSLYIADAANLRIRKIALSAALTLTLTCNPSTGPTTIGVAYTSTCTAAGGTPPYTFTLPVNGVAGASVPTGLAFTSAATQVTITGTPTQPGTFNYAVSVSDSSAPRQNAIVTFTPAIGSGSLSLVCNPAAGPATVGVAYTTTCTATAGTPPYAFTLNPNALPAGLTLNVTGTAATISGTPTAAGAYNYGVKAQDSATSPQSSTVTFTGNIAAGSGGGTLSLTQLSPSSATAGGAAFTLTVTGTGFGQTTQVQWNGAGLTTTFSSATTLTAAVPASLITSAGSANVTVSSGGNTSTALAFTISSATTTPPGAPPTILNNGIVNSASFTPAQSPGGAVAQGSIFSIFGTALGPLATAQQTSFPLVATLAGASVKVISGTTQLDAIPVFVSPGLINAIMPSNAPLGRVSVQVTFNGVKGNMSPVTVTANAPSIYTATGAGIGPGIFQNISAAGVPVVNTAQLSVTPGQIGVLWLTGLGAISVPDNQPPPVGNLSYPVEVWVGGQPVTNFQYFGRTPCCSGLDEIVFTVPPGVPSGCFVPVTVRVAGKAVSNTVTVAVDPAGNPCSDPISGAYTKGGNFGTISLVRRTTHVASATSADLIVDAAMAGFSQEAGAAFSFSSIASLPPAGSCAVYSGQGNYLNADSPFTTPAAKGLLAGTLTVKGSGNPVSLTSVIDQQGDSEYLGLLGSAGILQPSANGAPPFLNPGPFTIAGAGGPDVGPFSFSLTVPPSAVTWTNRDQITTVDRTQPLTFNWSGTSYLIALVGIDYDLPTNTSVEFQCVAPAGATSFTVPNWVLTNFPATQRNARLSNSFLGIAAATAPVNFQATGVNHTAAFYVLLQGRNVTFK